jgi:hypothetical protein
MSDLSTFYQDLFNNKTTAQLSNLLKQINQYVDERISTELAWSKGTAPYVKPMKTPLTYAEEDLWRGYGYYTPGTYDDYLSKVQGLYTIEPNELTEVLDYLVLRQQMCELLIRLEPLITKYLQPVKLYLQVYEQQMYGDTPGTLDIKYEVAAANDVDVKSVLDKERLLSDDLEYMQLYEDYSKLMSLTFISPFWAD